jgi:hypothetical protein
MCNPSTCPIEKIFHEFLLYRQYYQKAQEVMCKFVITQFFNKVKFIEFRKIIAFKN